jgi:hypothetical protein
MNKDSKYDLHHPFLPESPRGSEPFKVPAGYFDSLENDILKRISLEEGGPASSNNPFEVPVGYFDQLASSIEEKIHKEGKVVLISGAAIRATLAIAAVTVASLFLHRNLLPDSREFTSPTTTLTLQEIENSTYLDDLDETLVTESLVTENSSSEEVLIDYLIEDGIDIHQLQLEL